MGIELKIIGAVESVNSSQKTSILRKILGRFGSDLHGKHFAIWGLAFKPGTDDMREAVSRVVMEGLWDSGATISVYDPVAMEVCRSIYGTRSDLIYSETHLDSLENASALIILTEWGIFRNPNFDEIKSRLIYPVIFDGRNLFDVSHMKDIDFEYYSIGRSH